MLTCLLVEEKFITKYVHVSVCSQIKKAGFKKSLLHFHYTKNEYL